MSDHDLSEIIAELDAGIRQLEQLPDPSVRDRVMRVLELIDRLHRPGIQRMARALEDADLADRLGGEPSVRVLMDLYDLVPQAPRERVEDVLAIVLPYVEMYGCDVQVLGVDDGAVHVSFGGACAQDGTAAEELRRQLEAALSEGFPDFGGLTVHAAKDTTTRTWIDLPMAGDGSGPAQTPSATTAIESPALNAPAFREIASLEALEPERATLVGGPGGSVLLARAGNDVHGFEPVCSACNLALDGARVREATLVCPWCEAAYDVGSGRRLAGGGRPAPEAAEGASPHLRVLPVTIRNGSVLLAAGVGRRAKRDDAS